MTLSFNTNGSKGKPAQEAPSDSSGSVTQARTLRPRVFLFLACLSVGITFGFYTEAGNWGAGLWGALIGLTAGLFVLALEFMIESRPLATITAAAKSLAIGMALAFVFTSLLQIILPASAIVAPACSLASLLAFPYLSYAVMRKTRQKTGRSNPSATHVPPAPMAKVLDTSSIIDGRIVDLCETGFFEGPLLIPRFVLGELHAIADSPQSWKRARGKRGLDVLNNLQSISEAQVQIIEETVPEVPEVDHKLIKLAKLRPAKIVTNDWNLAKLASLEGVQTLNVNQLSYQLKPPVLPGETIRVLINKEGDLAGQGVAHLDDGTMVVVDQAREYVMETIDVVITKFMQTQSGRILFGSRV